MEKIDKLNILLITIMATCIFVFGFLCYEMINKEAPIFEESIILVPNSEQEIIDNCFNLSLEDTAHCLKAEISTFYNYTLTDDNIAENMTLDEIKEIGGDCGVYAYLYERLAKRLDFNSTTNNWVGKKDIYPGHRWAVMWDDEMYCRLDQLNIKCEVRIDKR